MGKALKKNLFHCNFSHDMIYFLPGNNGIITGGAWGGTKALLFHD